MAHQFVWYELLTTDTGQARKFYSDVVGWAVEAAPNAPLPYWLLKTGDRMVGGLMACPDGEAMPPSWLGYIEVENVDAAAGKVRSLGGAVHMEPHDIPRVGRFAVVADPQGAVFALMKWAEPGFAPVPLMSQGGPGWHELLAGNWEAVFPFYEAMFGWRKAVAMDMGPMGTYQLIAQAGSGEAGMQDSFGAMMTKPAHIPAPFWLCYFSVPSIDAAKVKVEAGGGAVANGPMEVPGGMWIIQCTDPQGAVFALVGPR